MCELHKRISLEKFEVWQQPDARWAARVALAWRPGGKASVGTAEGDESSHGQVRCAAEATARALELSVDGTMAITVLAVKVIDGFDTVLTVVSLTSRVDALAERVAGACMINGELARAAVLAVLSATNRLLGKMVQVVRGTSQAAVFYSADQESESEDRA